MRVIPAIDISDGKVIRLTQGKFERKKIYSDSPLDAAKKWASYGVELIHIVDLDGAREGGLKNFELVKEIVTNIKAKVELGGGIRDEATVRMALDAGIEKVVIGTKAIDQNFLNSIGTKYGDRIVAGIDARKGVAYTKGWIFKTKMKALDLARAVENSGIKTINYTDISKDGTLEGPNINSLQELLKAVNIDVIASGGISNIDDVKALKALEKDGLKGIIIGKALYENRIDLGEAIRICEGQARGKVYVN